MTKSITTYYAEETVNKFIQEKTIAVFGARIVAVEVASCLMGEPYHLHISKFVVSQVEENPTEFFGRPVISLSRAENEISKNTLIVIACMEKNLEEITKSLHQAGFHNLLPLTFECDLWSYLRGNYFMEYCRKNHKKYLKLEEELASVKDIKPKQEVCIYTAKCHVDKVLHEDTSRFSWEIPIQVGAKLTEKRICKVCDNTGDNISDKNREYCELTALYWIWKNTQAKYVGLCHYRRHFELDERQLLQLSSSDIDVVVTIPILNFPSVGEVYAQDHNEEDWKIMMEGIKKIAPEYINTAKSIQDGIYYYAYNMFIAKKAIFDAYCQWLFPVLSYCEKHCKKKESTYQNRYIGFLAERLLTIYMKHHEEEYKIVYAKKHFIDN